MSGLQTYDEQIEYIKKSFKGSDAKMRYAVEQIGFFRLRPYLNAARVSAHGKCPFSKVLKLYDFDREMRAILLRAIEPIELSFRTCILYWHGNTYGSKGYLDVQNFNTRHNHSAFEEVLKREIKSNNRLVVRYSATRDINLDNYTIWEVGDLFTLGTLSYFYADMKTADKKAVSKEAGIHFRSLESWLICCTDLRNICAHYGRLYNRIFTSKPSGLGLSPSEQERLWGTFCFLREMCPSPIYWKQNIVPRIRDIVERYESVLNLELIGFPKDWRSQLVKSRKNIKQKAAKD